MNKSKIKWQSTGNKNSSFKIKFACLWLRELTYHLGNRLLILSYNSPMDEKLQIFSICHIKSKRRRLSSHRIPRSLFFKLQKFPSLPLTCATLHHPHLFEPFQQIPVSYLSLTSFTVKVLYSEEMVNLELKLQNLLHNFLKSN